MLKMKIFAACFLFFLSVALISCRRESPYASSTAYGIKDAGRQNAVVNATICNSQDIEIQRHFITLEYAYQLINNYQSATKKRGSLCNLFDESGWVYSETFPSAVVQQILSQSGCCKYRIYNGLDQDNRLHLVMTGVNEWGADVLYCNAGNSNNLSDSCTNMAGLGLVAEMGAPCPQACAGTYVAP